MARRVLIASLLSTGLALALFTGEARGYLVGPAVSLSELTDKADIIFKGTAISNRTARNAPTTLSPVRGFTVQETDFKIVSAMKGEHTGDTVRFLHYGLSSPPFSNVYDPEYYHFELRRTYFIFAKKSTGHERFEQITPFPLVKPEEGVWLCANAEPVASSAVKDAVWYELMSMLKSADGSDVRYAIEQLDQMSGALEYVDTSDFDRTAALRPIAPFMTNADPQTAQTAITAIGSHNPYMEEGREANWLVTVGSAKVLGFAPMQRVDNIGGKLYWNALISVANSNVDNKSRALAISALGFTDESEIKPNIERWLSDPALEVRRSATILLADFPNLATRQRLTSRAHDTAPRVRAAAALEIGFAQQDDLADIIAMLLTDSDADVRGTAAMALLSFSPDNEKIADIFKNNIGNAEFRPLFINALAERDPEPYLDLLAKTIEQKPASGLCCGTAPELTAFEILMKYLEAQPIDLVKAGKLDRYLDALEHIGNDNSANQVDIYAFYVQRGMIDRANSYRVRADKVAPYNLDQYFQQVDAHPPIILTTPTVMPYSPEPSRT